MIKLMLLWYFYLTGIRSGKYLALYSAYSANTTAKITGPILAPTLAPASDCRIRFWFSMEGNRTNSGKLSLGAENLSTGLVTRLWTTYDYQFPLNSFGFMRRDVTIPKFSNRFRLVFTGEKRATP